MRRERWITSLGLGVGLFAVFVVNGRTIRAGDTIGAALLPVAIWRGDGLSLDRFHALWSGNYPWYVTEKHGHIVSRYPLAPPIVAMPLIAPQIVLLDQLRPRWEQRAPALYSEHMSKNGAAAFVAATGVILFQLLRLVGFGRVALVATLIAVLGSGLWVLASQALWQHGPAAFGLALTLLLLVQPNAGPARLLAAGIAASLIAGARPQNITLTLPIATWVVWRYRWDAVWFLPGPVLLGAFVVGANYWYFGTAAGGYNEIEPLALASHQIPGYWTSDVLTGAVGTLVSPSRGLFIFSPWTLLALLCLPATYQRFAPWPLLRVAIWSLIPFSALLFSYAAWWGGWSWGARYCTDAIPIFAILLAAALDWSWQRSRPMFAGLLLTGLVSVGISIIGAFYFPSTWNGLPGDINLNHARLWDWRDTELTRCLQEGPKPRW
jgi:hypothetical protein